MDLPLHVFYCSGKRKSPRLPHRKNIRLFLYGDHSSLLGDSCIGDDYDVNGIIDLVEFFGDANPEHWDETRLSHLTEDVYNYMLPSVRKNLQVAKDKKLDYYLEPPSIRYVGLHEWKTLETFANSYFHLILASNTDDTKLIGSK